MTALDTANASHRHRFRIWILVLMLTAVCWLTVYFIVYLHTTIIVTHLYYIPIILATLWWQQRGLWVAACLGLFLVSIHLYRNEFESLTEDFFRAIMFLTIGYVLASLSRNIARHQASLRIQSTDLLKRVQELKCLFDLSQLTGNNILDPSEVYRQSARAIPRGLLYPDIAWARLLIDGAVYTSDGFLETPWRMFAPIGIGGQLIGRLEVGYREARPARDEGPFLNEERDMLNTLTQHIAAFSERKKLQNELLEISEAERRRIGQDLHDGLGQLLTGIDCMAHAQVQRLKKSNPPEAQSAELIRQHINSAIAQARHLARGLCPVELEREGLMDALKQLAADIERMHSIDCRFLCSKPVYLDDYAKGSHLFRIAQESIHNAIRHGNANQITIEFNEEAKHCIMRICDNGSGFDVNAVTGEGMGLGLMRLRSSLIGGRIQIDSQPGLGTSVNVQFPGSSI